jgi:hypothetical protein
MLQSIGERIIFIVVACLYFSFISRIRSVLERACGLMGNRRSDSLSCEIV